MTMQRRLVVDASVVVKFLGPEVGSEDATCSPHPLKRSGNLSFPLDIQPV